MAKTKLSEYSSTANSNTDVASINIDEGMAPSNVNNAIRAIMGHLKDFIGGTSGDTVPPTAGGTGVANNASSTLTISGAYPTTLTVSASTGVTLPTTGTLSTLAGSETFTNKTLTNPTVTNYVESVVAIGNSSTSQTISLTSGTVQTCTLTGNCTFTMPTATAGKSFVLLLQQNGTGGYTATFTGVKWPAGTAPTITATASKLDVITFVSDGTNWYGNIAQNYAIS